MNTTEFLIRLQELSTDDLLSIKGIGETLAQNYYTFLNSNRYSLLLDEFTKLETNGFKMNISQNSKIPNQNLPLSKEVVCITGVFEISRSQIKTLLQENGAKIVESVGATTTILLAGEKSGSKVEKAKKLNIRIVQSVAEIMSH